jgi:6-phosphofructokinase 1
MIITTLGEPVFPSPLRRNFRNGFRVPASIVRPPQAPPREEIIFEMAGPRAKLFFDPAHTRAGIVTCGGLCPGLNNVIRSLYRELYLGYGVPEVLGFRNGYQGLDPARSPEPLRLTNELVDTIHKEGGTLLGTSRGPVDVVIAVDNLIRRGVNILFTIGGDGTQRGGEALFQEARKRGHALAVVGIPKTVDNDVAFVSRSFGYLTAVQEAAMVLHRAHTEAIGVHNGISLVKLMGRHAGFIAGGATIANQEVNFCLTPEIPFRLDGPGGFLAALERRLAQRGHAVIALAEGAGQDLLAGGAEARDASGNVKLRDIGPFLRDKIEAHFQAAKIPVTLRYFDPNYIIRSSPANTEDSIMCDLFARDAVHAAMAGKTGLVIGFHHGKFIHVPIELLTSRKKSLASDNHIWNAVLAATGQPARFE